MWRSTSVAEEPATSISGQKLEAAGASETCAHFLPNNRSERQEYLKLDIQSCEKSKKNHY
jgi:hypothetical protein